MADVCVGTSGYSYRDWVGPVYPAGTASQDFLELYSRDFNMVELNFSYYRMPQADMLARMAGKTSDSFLFTIKAHKSLTHDFSSDMKKNCAMFLAGVNPLLEAKKLGAILFQFPYSFHYTAANRKYLASLLGEFELIPVVVEFRNGEWQQESVYDGLARRKAGYVNVDEPALENLPLPASTVTSGIAYLRFHGRNHPQWWDGDNTSRYDYLYSREELTEWLPRVQEMIKTAQILLVAFNNHYKGQAIANARQFKNILKEQGIEVR